MIKTFFSVSKNNMLNFKPMELSSSWELWFFGVIKKYVFNSNMAPALHAV